MTNSQLITLTCEICKRVTNQVEVYEYYTADFKRIYQSSTNYCLECYQMQKTTQARIIKESGELKGFRLK